MTPSQVVGQMLNTSALTSVVTIIKNGNRPPTATTANCINYYELPGTVRRYGFENANYSINCRSVSAETALQMARIVDEIFSGSTGSGITACASSGSYFEISRTFTNQRQGLIPEPEDGIYNAPVDIHMTYPVSSIS